MKKFFVVLLALILTCTLAGAAMAETIKVAYMPNLGSLWAIVPAIESGAFEQEGLDVQLVEFADGPTIIAAMESGSIDVGYIGSGAHKLCIQGRAKIFAFSHMGNGDAVIGLKDKGVTKPEDLKGKTVGYASGTSSETILRYTLEAAGLAWEDITAVEMDASAIVTATISGSIDACACWSPSSFTILEQLGDNAVIMTDNVTFADQAASLSSWIVMSNYYDKNAERVERITRALFKGMDAAVADKEQACKWVASQLASDYDTIWQQRGDFEWLTSEEVLSLVADGTIESYYKSQQNGFISSGAVEAEVPVSDYVLLENMTKAAK